MANIEKKIISSKCKELVKGYADIFDLVTNEIVEEITSPTIYGQTAEQIALEYMKREGMKMGIKEFLRRINTKASAREDE